MTRTAGPTSLPGFHRRPLATVRVTDAELALHGIELEPLDADWEEPGPIEGSGVHLSGGDVWLVRYVGHAELGVEVRARDDTVDGYPLLRSLLRHLGLGQDRLIWRSDAATRSPASQRRGQAADAVSVEHAVARASTGATDSE